MLTTPTSTNEDSDDEMRENIPLFWGDNEHPQDFLNAI
jgi:hypothetical protein